MDKNANLVLRIDIETQMTQLEEIYEKLEQRAQDLQADDPARLESVAYQIHNLYNAVEDLLKLVAAHFENHIADADRWHSALLKRMAQMIPGLRRRCFLKQRFACWTACAVSGIFSVMPIVPILI